MDKKHKIAALSVGVATILVTGIVMGFSLKGKTKLLQEKNPLRKFKDWKKEAIHKAYYNTINKDDIAWG